MILRPVFAIVLVFTTAAVAQSRQNPAAPPARRVALTFDDLPLGQGQPTARCDTEALLEVSLGITQALVEIRAPSTAFVTTGNVCDRLRDPALGQVIRIWEQGGAVIGNHGHRHLDLNRVTLSAYLADVAQADSILRQSRGRREPGASGETGQDSRYFRHPFLHAGADTGTANALGRWLAGHNYVVAPVTIDNNEWIYARAYSLALGRGDSAMARRLVPAYLDHIDQAFAFAESLSVRVTGQEIPQVLLLHANELNRDHLREVLQVIRRRGYGFVTLKDALADPAYQRPTLYVGPWGISWILRWSADSTVWRMDLPRTPEWVEQ